MYFVMELMGYLIFRPLRFSEFIISILLACLVSISEINSGPKITLKHKQLLDLRRFIEINMRGSVEVDLTKHLSMFQMESKIHKVECDGLHVCGLWSFWPLSRRMS
ncbi:hypothetical protein RIF29_19779 [Crotalaria pallida]|uniref:Uncharacterized protein n=1 Tax=Crotalaria pallida TaxID=3830 RepID=A0AAN9I811_CROPI